MLCSILRLRLPYQDQTHPVILCSIDIPGNCLYRMACSMSHVDFVKPCSSLQNAATTSLLVHMNKRLIINSACQHGDPSFAICQKIGTEMYDCCISKGSILMHQHEGQYWGQFDCNTQSGYRDSATAGAHVLIFYLDIMSTKHSHKGYYYKVIMACQQLHQSAPPILNT